MVTHWKPDLAALYYPSGESSAQHGRDLFERAKANAEDPVEMAATWQPSWIPQREHLAWAVNECLRHESAWSAYENAGWFASENAREAVLQECVDLDPTVFLTAAGVPPHLTDRAARKVLEAAKYVRLRRLLELDEAGKGDIELTDSEYDLMDSFDRDQPWFVDSAESPAASGYTLMYNEESSAETIRRQIHAIDEFLSPSDIPSGYVTRAIQLKQGLIARAFVPDRSAWAPASNLDSGEEESPWRTGSVDRPVCVVARPLGLTDGSVGLDKPAEGVSALLERWNGEGMVVEVFPVWGEHSWRSADVAMPGGISPMTDGQVDALTELSVTLKIYANPREATMLGLDSGCYLALRHAEKGTLFEPVLLAGAPVSNELVASRAAWVTERGLRMPVYDLRGGPSNVDSLLRLPHAAHRIADPPTTRLTGRRDIWDLTGDKLIDRGLRQGREAVTQIMLYNRDIHTYDDVIREVQRRMHALSSPTSVEEYAALVGLYLHAPLALRERLGPLQLLQEPEDAHRQTIRGLDARRYATVKALIAAEASFDPRHLSRATELARRHPELDELDVAVNLGDVAQLNRDLERIERFLNPEGIEEEEHARLLVVDFDPTLGVGIRLWRSATEGAEQPRVLVGVPDPEAPGHAERIGKVSPALRRALRTHPEIAIAESWNRPDDVSTSLPLALFYVHTHQGPLERVFAEGNTGPIASGAYRRETHTVEPPWESRLQRYLSTTTGGRTSTTVRDKPRQNPRRPQTDR